MASARTVTVMVWVPALPPIEATMGISTASATICSMVASKSPMMTEARKAVIRLTTSQGARLRTVSTGVVGHLFVADAGQQLDVLLGLFLDDVDHVVDGEHADQPLVLVDHRDSTRS